MCLSAQRGTRQHSVDHRGSVISARAQRSIAKKLLLVLLACCRGTASLGRGPTAVYRAGAGRGPSDTGRGMRTRAGCGTRDADTGETPDAGRETHRTREDACELAMHTGGTRDA